MRFKAAVWFLRGLYATRITMRTARQASDLATHLVFLLRGKAALTGPQRCSIFGQVVLQVLIFTAKLGQLFFELLDQALLGVKNDDWFPYRPLLVFACALVLACAVSCASDQK